MPYIIQEIQTTGGNSAFLPQEAYSSRQEAEAAFYYKCGSAVISSVPVHTIMTYTEEGFPIPELTKCFKHEQISEPEEESPEEA